MEDKAALLDSTVEIVCAYVSNNRLEPQALPDLIGSVYATLVAVQSGDAAAPVAAPGDDAAKPTPAQIRKSIMPDHLISFIDGKSYRLLKRHLTINGLTPDAYRLRYGLPTDYPMVAPNYASERSRLAKELGLGTKGRAARAASKG